MGYQMPSDDGADWSLLEFAKKVAAIPKNVAKDLDRESSPRISENDHSPGGSRRRYNSGNWSSEIPHRASKEQAVESDNLQIPNSHSGDGHSISQEKQFRTPRRHREHHSEDAAHYRQLPRPWICGYRLWLKPVERDAYNTNIGRASH